MEESVLIGCDDFRFDGESSDFIVNPEPTHKEAKNTKPEIERQTIVVYTRVLIFFLYGTRTAVRSVWNVFLHADVPHAECGISVCVVIYSDVTISSGNSNDLEV